MPTVKGLAALTPIVPAVLLAACSAHKPIGPAENVDANAAPAPRSYVGESAVFAELRQDKGGSWILGTIGASEDASSSAYLVRLNDLAPVFDTRVAECEPQNYPETHKCSPAHPFRDKDVGVMGKIISGGIAAGTAGRVTEISRTYVTAFDEPSFNKAVDEALINSGLHGNRLELLTLLEEFAERSEAAQRDFETERSRIIEHFENTDELEFSIEPTVDGLVEYYGNDVDFRELLRIEPADRPALPTAIDVPGAILPCAAAACLEKARASVASLDTLIAGQSEAMRSAVTNDQVRYRLRCDSEHHGPYWFALECPDSVSADQLQTMPVPVRMTIRARDFDALYPAMQLSDENLSVDVAAGKINLTNLTNSFVTVVTQTVYYNSQVQTSPADIEIAPGATLSQPIGGLVSSAIDVEARFAALTPDKARRTTIEFGYAVQYRRGLGDSGTTLFDRRGFDVGCIADNRLRPGSCLHAPPDPQAASPGAPGRERGDTLPLR